MFKQYPKLDFLEEKEGLKPSKGKSFFKFLGKLLLGLFIIIFITISVFSFRVLSVGQNILQNQKTSIITQLKHLLMPGDKLLVGEEEDRINILLLGMGGEGHEGAFLTDTIIIVSFKPSLNQVALISLPRDLYLLDYGYKINYAYVAGENKKYQGGGGAFVSQIISQITALSIHYYIKVDFEGFRKIVDLLGGIDIYVERSFYDSQYPTYTYGYQTISFKKGWNHMNGEEALKYSRSRHGIVTEGEGSEASDFSRAYRQQQVLSAIKDKGFSLNMIVNPKKLNDILDTLGSHVKTNLTPWEILRLIELAKQIDNKDITNKVIDDSKSGFLYSSITSSGAFILLPKLKDWNDIQNFCQNIFDLHYIKEENAKIEIQNGTEFDGLANQTAKTLKDFDFNIIKATNYNMRTLKNTVIKDFTKGSKPYTLKALSKRFNTENILSSNYEKDPNTQNLEENSKIDILVILGQDYGEKFSEE